MRSAALLVTLLTLSGAVLVQPIVNSEMQASLKFAKFINQFGKSYSNDQWKIRFEFFKLNLEKIDTLNAKSKNATYGITQFADLSTEEFRSTILMKNPITPRQDKASIGFLPARPNAPSLPANLDWRPLGAVTPVKNQEQCGSCWAFSATENIESMWIRAGKATNSTISLAPQQIVDCDDSDAGCDGGNPPTAYQYVINAGGQDTEASYPYTAVDGTCAFNPQTVAAKISSWQYATEDYSEDTLQTNLAAWGPLSICVDASNWQLYTSGVMDWEECAWVNLLDHCVQLVGYQTTNAPTPYWIVRNSWGTSWGVNGYIWLAMGGDTCGLTHEATSAIV